MTNKELLALIQVQLVRMNENLELIAQQLTKLDK